MKRVKICGITNLEDAKDAINAGANALGFVFYKNSPRYIKPKNALKIVEQLPPFIQTVGLFVNEKESFISKICKKSKMQLAQIIDDSNSCDFNQIEVKSIKVIRATNPEDILKLDGNHFYLIDAFVDSFGGEGKRVPCEWFKGVDCSKFIIAGGLNAKNLKELKEFNFYGVDVSSGVEKSKGKKDRQKMINFVKVANEQ